MTKYSKTYDSEVHVPIKLHLNAENSKKFPGLSKYMSYSLTSSHFFSSINYAVVVVGFEANCPLVGPGPMGGVPFVGVFLRNPSPYLCKFWIKLLTSFPSTSFDGRIALPQLTFYETQPIFSAGK